MQQQQRLALAVDLVVVVHTVDLDVAGFFTAVFDAAVFAACDATGTALRRAAATRAMEELGIMGHLTRRFRRWIWEFGQERSTCGIPVAERGLTGGDAEGDRCVRLRG